MGTNHVFPARAGKKGEFAMEEQKDKLRLSRRVYHIPIEKIVPNPDQPRRSFDAEELRALADSIARHGVLQPLSVQERGRGMYVLVAGERRLRAAGLAGLSHVPCIVVQVSGRDSAILALVENLQRSDLHYLDEAAAISRLITTHGLSQEEAARSLGRSQSAVANKLRLLRLSGECAAVLRGHNLTERHARALLRLEGESERLAAAKHMGEKALTVAQSEAYIEKLLEKRQKTGRKPVYIIKDVRLFLNSLTRGVDTIRRAGVDATCRREESEERIVLTISIPKTRAPRPTP